MDTKINNIFSDEQYKNLTELSRVQLMKKIFERNQFYEHALDSMQLAVWTYDIVNKRIVPGNNAATVALWKKFNWPQVFENVPESTINTVDEDDREAYLAMFKEIESGHDAACEVWYQRHEGLEPYCERESYHVVCNEKGEPVLAYGIGQNITAEKKVAERYSREIEYLRHNSDETLIAKGHYNLSQNCVLEFECAKLDNIYTYPTTLTYDEVYEGMLEYSYSDKDRREISDKLNRINLIRRYQQGQMQTTLEYCRNVENHDPMWISLTVHTYMRPETGDLELFSYAYNITERKQNEIIMNLISQRTFDYIGLIYVKTGLFEFFKRSVDIGFCKVGEKVKYKDYCDYVRTNFVSKEESSQFSFAVSLENILAWLEKQLHRAVTYRRTENGKLLCKQFDYTWLDRESGIILLTRTDITSAFERDQKQMARIEAAKMEAERANEAKSNFLSSMSHDLRTPLNGIIGYTELALDAPELARKQELIQKVRTSSRLLLDLISDTLELSRIESGKIAFRKEAVDGEKYWEEIVTAMLPVAKAKNITLSTDFTKYPQKMIMVDRIQVKKILVNLLANAIKYTPRGGTVTVSIDALTPPVKGCTRRIVVQDTGIGMSKEFMKRMFEPFTQEQRSEILNTNGTGLGLAIVKRIVDFMGGNITVESVLHKGTKFTVDLPIEFWNKTNVEQEKEKQAAFNRQLAIRLANRRVLLCEDNNVNAEIAQLLLKNKHMLVDWAKDGQDGLEQFTKSAVGYYDLILMDLRMPRMDGLSATKAIRKLDRKDATTIPIIAMTADAFDEDLKRTKKVGMNIFITKPVLPDVLFKALFEQLGTK